MSEAHGMARWLATQLNDHGVADLGAAFQIIVTDTTGVCAQITYDYGRDRWIWEDGVDIPKLDARTKRF